jgi:hypothetical protein
MTTYIDWMKSCWYISATGHWRRPPPLALSQAAPS